MIEGASKGYESRPNASAVGKANEKRELASHFILGDEQIKNQAGVGKQTVINIILEIKGCHSENYADDMKCLYSNSFSDVVCTNL